MYKNVSYNMDTIPKDAIPSGCDVPALEIIVSNGDYVRCGDCIVRFYFKKKYSNEKLGTYDLIADTEGFVCGVWNEAIKGPCRVSPTYNIILLSINTEPVDALQCNYPSFFRIEQDPISSESILKWTRVAGYSCNYFTLSSRISIQFNIEDNTPVLNLAFPKKNVRLKKKDTVSFHFVDGRTIHLPVVSNPVLNNQTFGIYAITIPLTRNEITSFAEYGWDMMRISHANGESPMDVPNQHTSHDDLSRSASLFCRYAQEFKKALDELGITLTEKTVNHIEINDIKVLEEPCYVYLMVDTANGYHKIGISNHPEYRERTLQSEKPTIEKICAKQFPSRLIAQSIESALHTAFASKRIRGEWFNLSAEDIMQVVETLK